MKIKAIIFDWGRTLFDVDANKEYSDAKEILSYLKQKDYKICIASLVRANTTIKERKQQIETSSFYKYIDLVELSDSKEKDEMFNNIIQKLNIPKEEILLVDDRVVKSIKYGNKNGHPTVWFQNGLFANELPNEDTGNPTFIIHSLFELKEII
jgi:FMN phosphatase YigB (HAD superfamily)